MTWLAPFAFDLWKGRKSIVDARSPDGGGRRMGEAGGLFCHRIKPE